MQSSSLVLVVLLSFFMGNVIGFQSSFKSSSTKNNVQRKINSLNMKIFDQFDALLFDCDGVIAETERDVHRISFNQAFKHKGLENEWDVDLYGKLLKIGGGKERMTEYFSQVGWPSSVAEGDRKQFVQDLHLYKTDQFRSIVESGVVPPRPGVVRLIEEAFKNDIQVAVCSTSNEAAVSTIVKTLLGAEKASKIRIFAGDMVAKKKPSPDIYLLAASTLSLTPSRCWVIEDSEIGLKAAKAAGMNCCVTQSVYSRGEDFSSADVIVDDLDHGTDGPITMTYLNYKASPRAFKPASVTDNADMFSARTDLSKMFTKLASGEKLKGMPF